MLKITKGLEPYVEDGVSTYKDDKGNKYVRVKDGDEDFCITLHDYDKDDNSGFDAFKDKFTWDDAMKALKADGLTTFTKRQAILCRDYIFEISNKLKEIGGDEFNHSWYWTSTEDNPECAWVYQFYTKDIVYVSTANSYNIRPIINL